jgi:hypothetical protein
MLLQCTNQQIAVFTPNIKTLLQAVDKTVSVQSLNLVITFFERKDTADILKCFYTEKFKTRAELLTEMLTFMKLTYTEPESALLDAFNDILLHVKYDGLGALKSDFILVCHDISTSQVIPPQQTATINVTSKDMGTVTPSLTLLETECTKTGTPVMSDNKRTEN